MTDQPTTPTVDTDELRELLDEALGWIEDNVPRSETGASLALPGDRDLMKRIAAALARPVPAAPAEPGATEVVPQLIKIRDRWHDLLERFPATVAGGDADGGVEDDLTAIEGAIAALAASPAPADGHGWTHDGSMVFCERCGIELPIEDDTPTIWGGLVSKCEGPG